MLPNCVVCGRAPSVPYVCDGGAGEHVACAACVAPGRYVRCPKCDGRSFARSRVLSRIFADTQCSCAQCGAALTVGTAEAHAPTCLDAEIECGLCRQRILRRNARDHVGVCDRVPTICFVCGDAYAREDIETHMLNH